MVEDYEGERTTKAEGESSSGRPSARTWHRRQEVVSRLAEAGLTGDRRPEDEYCFDGRFGRRLGAALAALGPVFSAFGAYLASRPDLLSPPDCVALADLPERTAPTPPARVRERLANELGSPVGKLFSALEDTPTVCGPLFQMHHAWLPDEGPVVVKLLRPEWEEQWALDESLLPLVAEAAIRGERVGSLVTETVEDFRNSVRQRTALAGEAEALAGLADDRDGVGVPQIPGLFRHLCGVKVLTYRRRPGAILLTERAANCDPSPGADGVGLDARKLACRLWRVWLRLALRGRPFPVEFCSEDVLLLPNGALGLTGGLGAAIPAEEAQRLADYLAATATGDQDAACGSLLFCMRQGPAEEKAEALRCLLRQAVPFHHGAWSASGSANGLGELVMTHWRLARSLGFRPRPHLLEFFRGLCGAARLARRIAPGYDAMREALDDVRVEALTDQIGEFMRWDRLSEHLPKYAAALAAGPGLLDSLLDANQRDPARSPRGAAGRSRGPVTPSWIRSVGGIAFVVVVVLWIQHLAQAAGGWGPVQEVGAAAILLGWALLLGLGAKGGESG